MLFSSDLSDSELFGLITKKRALPHPTSSNFDPKPWVDAIEAIGDKKPRDIALATSALHYGREISSLRDSQGAKLIEGLSRSAGLRLLAAIANQQYLTLSGKVRETLKANKGKPVHFEELDQAPIKNLGGQAMKADDHATSLVDMLPHWLHHILSIAEEAEGQTPDQPDQFGGRAIMIASIERALRDLWQEALWSGHWLHDIDGMTVHTPADHVTSERWFVWELRQQSLLGQEMYLDLGAHIVTGGKLPPAKPVVERTVSKIFRIGRGPRRFKLGTVSGRSPRDRVRVSEHDALERLYTGLFLDEALPRLGKLDVNCRLLNKAWWVVSDLARLLADGAGEPWFEDDLGVGRFAFSVGREELVGLIASCLEIAGDRASAIVDFLTLDASDTNWLFGKGFWATPLLPDTSRARLYLMVAPLLVGSPLRRIEAWLEKGGLTDRAGIKGRGKPFEDHVRKRVADALSKNKLLADHNAPLHSLKRKGASEEIDLLIRIGNTLIIGEVKCFLFPSEPIERFNYLKNVESAAQQATTKIKWAEENRAVVAAQVGVTDPKVAKSLNFLPLVVTNHGFGLGLVIDGVAVVDLHYLRLLMSGGKYQGDMRFEKGVGVTHQSIELYKDQADFEARATDLIANPPPLRRYKDKVRWQRTPFQTSDASAFELELPVLVGKPMNSTALLTPEELTEG